MCWTDDRGELLETDLLPVNPNELERIPAKIWRQSTLLARSTSFAWRPVICKMGIMSASELADWTLTLQEAIEQVKNPTVTGKGADNINSITICWVNSSSQLQVFDSFFAPSQKRDAQTPVQNQPYAQRVLVSTQRVTFTPGSAMSLSTGIICDPNHPRRRTPWPQALEVSLVHHSAGTTVHSSSNSSFRAWSGDAVTMESVTRDICLQFHALSYIGQILPGPLFPSSSPTMADDSLLPVHVRLTKRLVSLTPQLVAIPAEHSPLRPAPFQLSQTPQPTLSLQPPGQPQTATMYWE